MTDRETAAEVLRGIEGVEAVDDDSGGSRLPFDPREKGPKDVFDDSVAWIRARRFWVAGAIAAIGALHYWVGIEIPSIPPWGWVAIATAPFAVPIGLWLGVRVGKVLSPSKGKLVSQLDGKDGQQELLRISEERYRDLRVIDHDSNDRPRDYLRDVTINGEAAIEADVYYPSHNVAVSSWQAGASNKDIRAHEHEIDQIKTEMDRAANEGLKTAMEGPQEVAAGVRHHSNVLIGAVEGVLTPAEVDLFSVVEEPDEPGGSQEDHLARIEAGLVEETETANGHDDEEIDRVDELRIATTDALASLRDRVPDRGGDRDGGNA